MFVFVFVLLLFIVLLQLFVLVDSYSYDGFSPMNLLLNCYKFSYYDDYDEGSL